ncbi:MAG: DsbC family protein [Gammaproteobacteria bacterium]|nr:MAG: DsbC family protein [Gammaproteobacteria bacterium]
MFRQAFKRGIAMGLTLVSMGSQAGEAPSAEELIRKSLSHAVPGVAISSIEPSPLPGIYMVETANRQLLYASGDGRYILSGDMYQIDGTKIANMTEMRRENYRRELLASISESDMVVFKPEGPVKAVINVFTDVDCGYCRKLHKEVPQLNEMGVQVNYLAYPRAGIGSSSYKKMVSIWCADDPQAAMTIAKQGGVPPEKTCENPVEKEFDLGNRVGVTGTPAILLSSGRLIPGYVPAANLARTLGIAAN